MRIRLGWKLGLTYLVLIALSMTFFGYFTMRFFEQSFIDERKSALFTHAAILANSSAPFLRDEKDDDFIHYLARDYGERVGSRFLILDGSAKVVADSAKEYTGRVLGFHEIKEALQGQSYGQIHYEPKYGWLLYAAVPVSSGKKVIGAVFVSDDINSQVKRLDEIRNRLIWFSLVSGMIVLIISLFLGRFFTKPVGRLISAARKIENGEYGFQVEGAERTDELGELMHVFNEMSAKIKSEDSVRRQFVADASHELKTPVASLKALLDSWPVYRNKGQDISELMDDLKQETNRLSRLIEDLLVLSRMENNRHDLKLEEVSVGEVIEAVKKSITPLAEKKNLTVEISGGGDIYWVLDGEKIFRAILNLAENAVKYSLDSGRVLLDYGIKQENLFVSVTDTGPGIPEDEIPRIFDRFYRVDKTRSRVTGGWGLGLAIVKETIELHGGTIHVQSIPKVGTVFRLEIPKA